MSEADKELQNIQRPIISLRCPSNIRYCPACAHKCFGDHEVKNHIAACGQLKLLREAGFRAWP